MNHLLAGYDRRSRYVIAVFFVLFLFLVIAGIAGSSDYFKLFPLFLLLGFALFIIIKRPQTLLFFFIVLLPFQYFIMMVLFGVGHVPSRWITIISAWKEVFILLVFISLFVQLLLERKIHFRWSYVDTAMAVLAVYALIHFFLPDSFFGVKSNINLRLYGFKSEFFFIFLYFAGRLCPFNQRQVRHIYFFLIGIGVITALLGIFEVSFLDERAFLKLGYVDYTENHMGIKYKGAYGLAENFWADVGGLRVRRAVSVYMSSQPFAQSYLLIIPFSIALLFDNKFKDTIPHC